MESKPDEKTLQIARQWTMVQPKVSAYVTAVVQDFKDRDDLVQDIAVAVFQSFDKYDSSRPFQVWAMGVARNQFHLYLRKKYKHNRMFDAETLDVLEQAFAYIPQEKMNRFDHLNECIQRLQNQSKQLCELRYIENLKPSEISERLRLPGTAVRKSLQRIREQLKTCIENKSRTESKAL